MSARLGMLLLAACAQAADMPLPEFTDGKPAAGRRAVVTAPEYSGTRVRHVIALPDDWTPDWKTRGRSWPVIVEYTGNYFPTSGSTGEVEGAGLGYGLMHGQTIWVVLPYVAKDGKGNERTWWGDVDATVRYAKTNVPRICAEFGGDPRKIALCGFSRGAIGVSFLGLHDDEIAGLWRAFWTHDHFDGAKEWKGQEWGSPLARYREEAVTRLRRLKDRPLLITGGGEETRRLLEPVAEKGVTFLTVDMKALYGKFPNEAVPHPHTDRWPLRESEARRKAEHWLESALR
ncbi:MAG: hypothetical protein ACKOY8_03985 [Verrucomicrobiota bacterium]